MKKRLAVLAVLLAVAWIAGAEPEPDYGYDQFTIYQTGTCGVSMSYNGFFERDCNGKPHYGGTRSGQWRHISGDNCFYPYDSYDYYEVCTSGSNCTDSGTWVSITETQFYSYYCP